MFTLGKVLISTRGLALGNYHFYMNAKPSVAMVQGEMCQCPLGLIPHFYMVSTTDTKGSVCHVSMPSRAYTSFLPYDEGSGFRKGIGVNALSGLYLISTISAQCCIITSNVVSMPSRAYTSFLLGVGVTKAPWSVRCQCPLGLIPHFYGPPSKT